MLLSPLAHDLPAAFTFLQALPNARPSLLGCFASVLQHMNNFVRRLAVDVERMICNDSDGH